MGPQEGEKSMSKEMRLVYNEVKFMVEKLEDLVVWLIPVADS